MTVRIPAEQAEVYEELAAETGLSLGATLRMLLSDKTIRSAATKLLAALRDERVAALEELKQLSPAEMARRASVELTVVHGLLLLMLESKSGRNFPEWAKDLFLVVHKSIHDAAIQANVGGRDADAIVGKFFDDQLKNAVAMTEKEKISAVRTFFEHWARSTKRIAQRVPDLGASSQFFEKILTELPNNELESKALSGRIHRRK